MGWPGSVCDVRQFDNAAYCLRWSMKSSGDLCNLTRRLRAAATSTTGPRLLDSHEYRFDKSRLAWQTRTLRPVRLRARQFPFPLILCLRASRDKAELRQLLLDEEGPQVGQLPGASHAEHDKLDQNPAHHTRVGALRLITELGFAFLYPT